MMDVHKLYVYSILLVPINTAGRRRIIRRLLVYNSCTLVHRHRGTINNRHRYALRVLAYILRRGQYSRETMMPAVWLNIYTFPSSIDISADMPLSSTLYKLPIPARPARTWSQTFNAILFIVVFDLGCLMTHAFQILFLLPLIPLPFAWPRVLYEEGIRYTKGCFVSLLRECRCKLMMATFKGSCSFCKPVVRP